ncbi:MAG: peptidoglycan binding domain-containing protein, partial [Acidimicrobiia bacterium]|nr:peptidoglycan binding domain-containing protein [Acidimicrobiia bacterium]
MPLMLLLLPLSIYWVDSAMAADKVARNVSIEGTDVSRYTPTEAAAVVDAHADELEQTPLTVSINGHEFTLDPNDVNVTFERQRAVERALSENKDGLTGWVRAFRTEVDVPIVGSIDRDMLAKKITGWEHTAIENPAFEGAVTISGQTASGEYPRPGVAVDRDDAYERISKAITTGSTELVELNVVDSNPTLTA